VKVDQALAALRGAGPDQQTKAVAWLAKQPANPERQEEVARALGALLSGPALPGDTAVLGALKVWSTKENVLVLLCILDEPPLPGDEGQSPYPGGGRA